MKDPNSQNSTSQNKQNFAYRFAHGWFRKVWKVRGGGLYAVGYILTFLFFEAKTLAEEVAESTGIADFLSNQIFEFVIRFATDSLQNMIKAFMWPVYIVELAPPYGAIALGLAFFAFPKYLKKPIEKWLFGDDKERAPSSCP